MRVLTLLVLFVILPSATAYGQSGGREAPIQRTGKARSAKSQRVPEPLPLDESMKEIKATRPEVSYRTLYYDMDVVKQALPAVRNIFSKRGFLQSEADDALIYGWEELRIRHLKPTEMLSPEVLIRYVSGYGKVIIKTKPAGAVVVIGGKRLPDKTEAVAWSSAGTHPIKLSIDGYEPIEGTCAVEEGKTTVFARTFKPLKLRSGSSIRKKN
jgi:hypothetical protein